MSTSHTATGHAPHHIRSRTGLRRTGPRGIGVPRRGSRRSRRAARRGGRVRGLGQRLGSGRDGARAGHGTVEQPAQARGQRAEGARRGLSLFATGDLLAHDSIIRQARRTRAGPATTSAG